jgi:2-aminoethylphosphonate-pyruvate transaminase
MDLLDQWQYMQKTGQWRFTPPTHVVAALRAAIDQYHAQGGPPARLVRYTENCARWCPACEPGFQDIPAGCTAGADHRDVPLAARSGVRFCEFYRRVRDRGFILYPGKLTAVDTFRVGCIGAIDSEILRQAVAAIAEVSLSMGVHRFAAA